MNIEMSFRNRYYPWTEIRANNVTCWLKGTFFYENELLQGDDVVRLVSSVLEDSPVDHEALRPPPRPERELRPCRGDSPAYFLRVDASGVFPLYAVNENEHFFKTCKPLRDRLNPPFNEENVRVPVTALSPVTDTSLMDIPDPGRRISCL